MANKISCRAGVYGGWETAVKYLPKAGIKYIELEAGDLDDLKKAAEAARAKGITPLTLSGGVDACKAKSIQHVKDACDAAQELGVNYFFLSAHGEDYDEAIKNLRDMGEYAKSKNVTLCLETHPPFCTDGEQMAKTMSEVDHPNVRINFDTANMYFYNKRDLDSSKELDKVANKVGSVHLKDSYGDFESMNFPVFGEGIVNFPAIFKKLHDACFDGPLTMELEGDLLTGLDAGAVHEKVQACMSYLKNIGEA